MPEIAEVEIQRSGIDLRFRGQTLREIEIEESLGAFADQEKLLGQKLCAVLRRGKLLGLEFEKNILMVHLRMTGGFFLEPRPHTRARFLFDEPLYFADPRHFATMVFEPNWSQVSLGPDLWSLAPGWIPPDKYSFSRRAIKTTILDQQVLAGIGNYLADESLWAAGVSPFRITQEVSHNEWEKIIAAAQSLSRSVLRRGGVSLRDYKNLQGGDGEGGDLLRVYGKAGENCLRCDNTLIKDRLGGRGTTWCPACQV